MSLTLPLHEGSFDRIAGTRLWASFNDGNVEIRGPCGHSHVMTQEEAEALAAWLWLNVNQGWGFTASQRENEAMLDAEIGIA